MAATGVVEEWIPAFAGMTKEKKGHALALGAERGESTGRGDLDLGILGRSGRAMDDTRPSLMAHEIAEDRPAAAPADPLDIPMPPRLETPQGTLCAAPPPGSRIGEPANDRTAAPGISKKIVCDLLRLADFATILGACMASYWIYLRDVMPIGAFLAYGAAAALAATYVFGRLGLYGFERLRNLTWQVSKLALGWSMVLMLGLAAAFLTKTSTDLSRGCSVAGVFDRAHDDYLEAAFDLGIPAAILLVLTIGYLGLQGALGVFRRRRDAAYPALAAAATALVAVHSLVDFSLQMPAVSAAYAFLLGLGHAQAWSRRQDPAQPLHVDEATRDGVAIARYFHLAS
jgi:hypothetical protein